MRFAGPNRCRSNDGPRRSQTGNAVPAPDGRLISNFYSSAIRWETPSINPGFRAHKSSHDASLLANPFTVRRTSPLDGHLRTAPDKRVHRCRHTVGSSFLFFSTDMRRFFFGAGFSCVGDHLWQYLFATGEGGAYSKSAPVSLPVTVHSPETLLTRRLASVTCLHQTSKLSAS